MPSHELLQSLVALACVLTISGKRQFLNRFQDAAFRGNDPNAKVIIAVAPEIPPHQPFKRFYVDLIPAIFFVTAGFAIFTVVLAKKFLYASRRAQHKALRVALPPRVPRPRKYHRGSEGIKKMKEHYFAENMMLHQPDQRNEDLIFALEGLLTEQEHQCLPPQREDTAPQDRGEVPDYELFEISSDGEDEDEDPVPPLFPEDQTCREVSWGF